jgi:hypothetical protein
MLPTPISNQDSKPQKSFQAVVEESILQENSSPKSDKYQLSVSSQIGTDMERLLDRAGMLKWQTTPNAASRYGTGYQGTRSMIELAEVKGLEVYIYRL